jgi:ribosomal-protein-alanine N-acetyltransferase
VVFLRSHFAYEVPPVLRGRKVFLRTPAMDDFEAWASLRMVSRDFLVPWEPSWPADDLTRAAFRNRIKRYMRDMAEDSAYPFFIFEQASGELTGAVTIANVRRGVAEMGSLGYWIGAPFTRQGLMTDAVNTIVAYGFGPLRLHRMEAACLPTNVASRRLLLKCGFTQEGYARRYLRINGTWQDHLTFARLNDDPLH